MRPVLSTTFCVVLLAAAAAAFALTEGAKTELSPIYRTKVDKVFSPFACCLLPRRALIHFALRHPERLKVWIEHDGRNVDTLVDGRHYARGAVNLFFSGRGPDRTLFPDGAYFPFVRLLGDHRVFALPNEIQLVTQAPHVVTHSHVHALIAPGSIGAPQAVSVAYTLSGHAHGVLFANGHRVAITYYQHPHYTVTWTGKIDEQLVPPGSYTLSLLAQDVAGNRSKPVVCGHVVVRYLELAQTQITVKPRERFRLHVLIGPRRLDVRFAGRRLSTTARVLALRAPHRRGRYEVYVSGAGHSARALVDVT